MKGRIQSEETIKSEWVTVACAATGYSAELVASIVDPIMDYLQTGYAGERIYWPVRGRLLDIEQIKREYIARIPAKEICRRHCISRSTLYRLIDEAIQEGMELSSAEMSQI